MKKTKVYTKEELMSDVYNLLKKYDHQDKKSKELKDDIVLVTLSVGTVQGEDMSTCGLIIGTLQDLKQSLVEHYAMAVHEVERVKANSHN